MRLTVHVTGAKSYKAEKTLKDGSIKTYYKTPSTLSFYGVEREDESAILAKIVEDKLGKPFKSYFSNEKMIGRSKKKKK